VKVIQVKLRLYQSSDDDLIAFFARIPRKLKASMVKQALRSGMSMADSTPEQEDLFETLDAFVN
jgi:hypothetical protein